MNEKENELQSSLSRFRSAPSSFFASLAEEAGDYLPKLSGTNEVDHATLVRYFSGDSSSLTCESSSKEIQVNGSDRSVVKKDPNSFLRLNEDVRKHRLASIMEGGPGEASLCSSIDGFRVDCDLGDVNGFGSSASSKGNLSRHRSFPSGHASPVDGQNVYENGMRDMLRDPYGEIVPPRRLSTHLSCVRQEGRNSRPSHLSGIRLPEVIDKLNLSVGSATESLDDNNSDNDSLCDDHSIQNYMSGFSIGSWSDKVMASEGYGGIQDGMAFSPSKCAKSLGGKMMRPLHLSETQVDSSVHLPTLLNSQFTTTKTDTEIAMQKLLEVSMRCKIRAKRGCATHPRSIAERVRRTRISERMKKLQELVPDMEKQMNTADMLDKVAEYIKLLQKQVQGLSEMRSKCTCSLKISSDAS